MVDYGFGPKLAEAAVFLSKNRRDRRRSLYMDSVNTINVTAHIQIVGAPGEGEYRKGHACNGSCHKHENAQLNQALPPPGGCISEYSVQCAQFQRRTVKHSIVRRCRPI